MGCCESTEKVAVHDIEPLPRDCDWNKWTNWKEKLLKTINNEILKIESLDISESVLKKVIGPYGLNIIAENFLFNENFNEHNFNVLLNKLDTFFYLRRFPRNEKTESIEEYIERLERIAKQFGRNDPDTAVREKIIYDLNQNHFLEIITEIISIRNSFHLKHLNTNEIIFLINAYENQQSRVKREDFLQNLENDKTFRFLRDNHSCCGCYHLSHGTCPAKGQQCYKCNGLDHFAKTCNKLYIIDCIRCGINHVENQCPAFGMLCSRCDGLYHFYWKCSTRLITFCDNCGNSHVDVKRKCLAFGKMCSKCGKIGHLSRMCPITLRITLRSSE